MNEQNVRFETMSECTLVYALVAFEWLLPAMSNHVLFDFPWCFTRELALLARDKFFPCVF